jgi:hypothetical protein
VPDRDRRAHNNLVVRIARDTHHKCPVDLAFIDRYALQIRKRRIPGTEIVDAQVDARPMQAIEHCDCV